MVDSKSPISYKKISINGIVQGVGFRPFVFRIALGFGLKGFVKNKSGRVEILAAGTKADIDKFVDNLVNHNIPHARIEGLSVEEVEAFDTVDFYIAKSESGESSENSEINRFFSPDLAICKSCEDEIFDVANRRFEHFFNTCTACGPRFSILKAFPYDRINTSMDCFEMCADCDLEYNEPRNSRFHAETISCRDCGPVLFYRTERGEASDKIAFTNAVEDLNNGKILAIKGIGGYHFACSPYSENAVSLLRMLKGREHKPFAIMFRDLDEIKKICFTSKEEDELLCANPRPIVLLKIKKHSFAPSAIFENNRCGCFLPYTPLQKLLFHHIPSLIMTSANISSTPIIKDDTEIFDFFKKNKQLLHGVVYNKRDIIRRLEDSVAQIVQNRVLMIRRSRGYAPLALPLKNPKNLSLICLGGDLKASFAITKGKKIIMSQFIGDLENFRAYEDYKNNLQDAIKLFDIKPEIVVRDAHPGYFSHKLAEKLGMDCLTVLHHHAHIASVMAEHGLQGKVLGVAFDGSGYGSDGQIWGGEFLICESDQCLRLGHLEYVKILGADEAAKDALKTAFCFSHHYGVDISHPDKSIIKAALENNINTFYSSSMGRLFDTVAAMLNIGCRNDYEGQCATDLQRYAENAFEKGVAPMVMEFKLWLEKGQVIFSPKEIVEKLRRSSDISQSAFALGFHYAIADMVLQMAVYSREKQQINQIALSGGVFQNAFLLDLTVKTLKINNFSVFWNCNVPPNDAGIALGQAYLAAIIQAEKAT